MRRRFGEIITKLADENDDIFVIVADIGYRVFDDFRDKYPARFINMGICEQSIISVASGMALEGLQPWVYTITPFLIERPFEQIKLDIDQQNVNAAKDSALKALIRNALKRSEIKRLDIKNYNDQEVENYIQRISQNIGVEPRNLKDFFLKNNIDYDMFLNNYINELKWNTLIFRIYKNLKWSPLIME